MITISRLKKEDSARLIPLLEVWAAAHKGLPFRPDYKNSFEHWINELIDNEDSAVFVALDGSNMVGAVIGSIIKNSPLFYPDRFGHVNILVVSPDYRKKGTARRLWKAFEAWCREKGVEELRLYTFILNEQARRYWQSHNFETRFELRVHLPEN